MRCPSCGYLESKVVDSRPSEDGTSIRRRRECLKCQRRFTTYERLGDNPLVIVKVDGSSEAYDRNKLFRGLLIACAQAADFERTGRRFDRQHRNRASQYLANRNQIERTW